MLVYHDLESGVTQTRVMERVWASQAIQDAVEAGSGYEDAGAGEHESANEIRSSEER